MIRKKILEIPINIPNGFSLFFKKRFDAMVSEAEMNAKIIDETIENFKNEKLSYTTTQQQQQQAFLGGEVFADIENSLNKPTKKNIEEISKFIERLVAGKIKTITINQLH